AVAIFGEAQTAQEQDADHREHRDQYRLQEHPAGTFVGSHGQLVGAQGDADAEQRVMGQRLPGALPIRTHASSRRCWRSISFCISQPAKASDTSSDSTSAPTTAQKSAAISLA